MNNESESLGAMIARMRQKQIAKDWNKLTPAEKIAKLKKDREDLKKRMAEGKNHSWKSEGHYTKDGKEWKGPQHAHNGQVMTGEKHTADSQNLYHFKALSKDVQKKVLAKIQKEEVDYTQGCPLLEKLNPSMGIGKYIKDFKKSDAPQFKGASASKRRRMAVAAYLGAKRKMKESMEYDSTMGVMDWGTPKGTEYMKSNTPGETEDECVSCKGAGCSHCNYRGSHSRHLNVEETEAGETKKKYREDNTDLAPEIGIDPLSKDDIQYLYSEIETMSEDDMEEYGFFDDEDDDEEDDLESDIDWDDFDMEEVDIMEVLSVQGRLKRKFAARKNKQKLRVARNIALRRGGDPKRLKKRAVRGARSMVYKRLLKGRDKSTLPPAEKQRYEKLIKMYTPLITRIAARTLPKMRQLELKRMKNRRNKQPATSKKYKVSRPITSKSSQKAKKFKVKK